VTSKELAVENCQRKKVQSTDKFSLNGITHFSPLYFNGKWLKAVAAFW